MEARKFVTVGGDPAYLLVAGNNTDRTVLGVAVAVSLAEAERAAELEANARATRTGRYFGAEPFRPDLIPVHVEVSAVIDPPPPDVGMTVFGAETVSLPVGSIIQPVPPPQNDAPAPPEWRPPPPMPPAPPLLRTAGGWYSTDNFAWDKELPEEAIIPASTVRFKVIFRALDGQP